MLTFLPNGISSFAGDIDGVMSLIYWICGVWFVLAEGVLLALVVTGRKRVGGRAAWLPADALRAAAWVLVPASLVLACDFVIETRADPVWRKIKLDVPAPAFSVLITGRQFLWLFTYPGADGKLRTPDDFVATELHVPVGKPVRFELESADVLHSFFVPELRLKQDAVPGRSIAGWFDANTEGRFEIACSQICGPSHTAMRGVLVAESDEAFGAWSAAQAARGSAP